MYEGYSIPLPEWFHSGNNCKLTIFTVLENFVSYVMKKGNEFNGIFEDLNNLLCCFISFYCYVIILVNYISDFF